MKNWLPCLLWMLCASVALAEPPSPPPTRAQQATSALVQDRLLTPLKKAESRRKRFSRAAPVALQRRVRVLDAEPLADVRGKRFVRFAVDERQPWDEEGAWQNDAVLGCAYPADSQLFVQRDEDYVPADSLLGKWARAHPSACRAAPAPAEPVEPRTAEGAPAAEGTSAS